MLPIQVGATVLMIPNEFTGTFSIPPAFLARFPDATHWQVRLESDGIKVSPRDAPPPDEYEPPTQEEIQAAIAETRAALRDMPHTRQL